jgi:hypothetical protein
MGTGAPDVHQVVDLDPSYAKAYAGMASPDLVSIQEHPRFKNTAAVFLID